MGHFLDSDDLVIELLECDYPKGTLATNATLAQ